jgi:hypothetical protein
MIDPVVRNAWAFGLGLRVLVAVERSEDIVADVLNHRFEVLERAALDHNLVTFPCPDGAWLRISHAFG